jgi:formate dehydrogenase maturation protein FdhE
MPAGSTMEKGMAISEKDAFVLSALDEARAKHKELATLLDFYRDLYEVQFKAKPDLPQPQTRDDVGRQWRLEGGIPQLTFDRLGLEPDSFFVLVQRIADVLARHNPGWQIDWTEWTPEKLAGLAREVLEFWETLTTPGSHSEGDVEIRASQAHPATLAVGLSLAPYLQRGAEAILPQLDLSLWQREYCPVCGGRPNLAMLEEQRGARLLVCSRCGSTWPYARVGCPFCRSQAKQNYYRSDDGVYRLYVCPDCNRYLKTVDVRELHRPVYPAVERLLTVGMDLAARQQGFMD